MTSTSTSDQAKPVAIVKPLTFTERMKALRIIHTPSGAFRMEGFGCWDRIPDSLVKHRKMFEKIGSKVFRRGFAVSGSDTKVTLTFKKGQSVTSDQILATVKASLARANKESDVDVKAIRVPATEAETKEYAEAERALLQWGEAKAFQSLQDANNHACRIAERARREHDRAGKAVERQATRLADFIEARRCL